MINFHFDSTQITDIESCNNYLEDFFKNHLGSEYYEDVSEKIGSDSDSRDIKQFYYYSLYCWRIFYYIFSHDKATLESTTGKYLSEMYDNSLPISRATVEYGLDVFIFHVAKLVIIHRLYGGMITASLDTHNEKYLDNFYKIQEKASYISSIPQMRKDRVDFNILTNNITFRVLREFVDDLDVKNTFSTIKMININEINLSAMMKNQESLKTEVNAIEKRLEGYKGEYNFVELSSAFTKIRASKEKERSKSTRNYWVCMLTLMAFPVFAIWSHWGKTNFEWGELFVYIPMVTLEILFLYFMRIFYVETKNINSQILQIDLRLSLCEFIQGYVRYRKENNDSDDVLKSFETLIFSPIQASGDNIPSVLDGANVLAELAGNILKAKER